MVLSVATKRINNRHAAIWNRRFANAARSGVAQRPFVAFFHPRKVKRNRKRWRRRRLPREDRRRQPGTAADAMARGRAVFIAPPRR